MAMSLDVGIGRVPIVPAAVLFDLPVGDMHIRPDAASRLRGLCRRIGADPAEGNVGAGTGADVGSCLAWPAA